MCSIFFLSVLVSTTQLSVIASVPPTPRALVFGSPSIVSGPECPTSQGGGPWWDKVRAVSETHALGWAESHLIATKDAGKTWYTLVFNDSCVDCGAGTSRIARPGPSITGPFHTLGHLNLTRGSANNITGTGAVDSTHFSVDSNGDFVRQLTGPIDISGCDFPAKPAHYLLTNLFTNHKLNSFMHELPSRARAVTRAVL